jgi:hypothetical protein
MSVGYSREFNDQARPGYSPEAAEAAMRRQQDSEQIQQQQAFERQKSGAAADAGEIASAAGAARRITEDADREEKERKERTDRQILLQALDQAQAFAEQRAADAEALEAEFEAEFGDAWREEIANRVLDPDDIPERQPGESMEDYRERLADTLIEHMVDPETGEIRPEYRDDPELSRYADWALARYDERNARAYVEQRNDPTLSPEDQERLDRNWLGSATEERMQLASQEAARNGENIEPLANAIDQERSNVAVAASTQAGLDAFS